VRDKRDRSIQEVLLVPAPGQVAYIDERPTPFRNLRSADTFSLYVPEYISGLQRSPAFRRSSWPR
jgi:hypothetical protein